MIDRAGRAVTTKCDGYITLHTAAALKAGATREEIVEALGTTAAASAGAAIVYSVRTLYAFDAHSAVDQPKYLPNALPHSRPTGANVWQAAGAFQLIRTENTLRPASIEAE